MTQPNRFAGKDNETTKSSREIESEISDNRSAITGDIKALTDKFTPGHIKDQAKDAMGAVKDAAVEQASQTKDVVIEKAIEVKDAVVDKAIEVKDAAADMMVDAKEAVADTMHDVGAQAMRAGSATWRFSKANAVPLALLGLGAGWLISNNRSTSQRTSAPRYLPEASGSTLESDTNRMGDSRSTRRMATEPGGQWASTSYVPGNGAMQTRESTGMGMGARAHNMMGQATDTVQRVEKKVADGAARSARYVQEKFRDARSASSDFAMDNPLIIAVATLCTGVGIGMMLPSSERETKLLAPTRAKFQNLLGDVREAATDVAQVAKDTANESLSAMT